MIIYDTDNNNSYINTIVIEYSDCNDGWMYYVYYDKEMTREELANDETGGDDGGLCTGSLYDALGMAGIKDETLNN
jgi:hypothetical protein